MAVCRTNSSLIRTQRVDGGQIGRKEFNTNLCGQIRASAMVQDHDHVFGDVVEDDKHESYLFETSLTGDGEKMNWVLGLAWQSDQYQSDAFPVFDYTYNVPGVFGQIDYDVTSDLSMSLSARLDDHLNSERSSAPVFCALSPRKLDHRGSIAEGFFAPTHSWRKLRPPGFPVWSHCLI